MHDVAIVGGGPGGLYLAWLLASEGFDVVVLEEHREIGSPVHCTGVLAREAFDEFLIPRETILNELQRVRFFSPSGDSFEYATERIEAVVVDRRLFDHQLSLQARQAGASVLTSSRANSLTRARDRVTVDRDCELPVEARVVVLACGADYRFQRQLGLGVPSTHLQTAQVEVAVGRSVAEDSEIDVNLYFGRNVAPGGFAWTVRVHRGSHQYLRVGLMCDRSASTYFDGFLRGIANEWEIEDLADHKPRRKILPLGSIERTVGERLLVVGDAAGIVKPTTGGGIYFSIASAALAADVLCDGLRSNRLDEAFLMRYQEAWKGFVGVELQAQSELRRLAERLEDGEIDALFELANTNGLLHLVRKTARFNKHRHLIAALLKHPETRRILVKELVG